MKKLIAFLLVVLVCAGSNASLTIDPYKIEIKMDKNSYFESKYSVQNNYESDIDLKISFEEWGSYKANKSIGAESWLKIDPAEIFIPKGESREISYSVKTNENMQGSLLAQVAFTVLPVKGGGYIVKMSLPIHVIVRQTEKVEFDVKKLSVSVKAKEAKLNIEVENTGNILIKPYGEVKIYKGKKLVNTVNLEPTSSVFIDSKEVFSVKLPKELVAGKYIAEVNIRAYGYDDALNITKKIAFRVKKDGSIVVGQNK
ncbi:MAG: hypothetical protein LBO62_02510 [Endomicrobium sp.]|jgi:hypothetical protein|nr:hypothetical protein [Endomicrobium sp.]